MAGLALGAGWWGARAGAPGAAKPEAALPAGATAPEPVAMPRVTDRTPATVAAVAASFSVATRPATVSATTTATTTATVTAERERQARERRAQTDREKTAPRNARSGTTAPGEPQRLADAAPPPSPAAPATPAVTAQTPPTGQTVDQSCADTSNFLTRDFCRVRACRNPAMAGDPVCVRFREMEASNRNRTAQ